MISNSETGRMNRRSPNGEKRLVLAARALAYGEKILYSGPTYDRMTVEGDKVVLTFKNVGGGLVAKGEASTYEGGRTMQWLKVKQKDWTVEEDGWRRRISAASSPKTK